MATILVVEDGTGKANANTYATEAELLQYADDRATTLAGNCNTLLIRAMDYIEQQSFKGEKNTKAQALQWPRINVWIDGFTVDNTEIPQLLKDAQLEAALAVDAGNNPMASIGRETKREKLEGLEVEYMDGARGDTFNRALETKLTRLLKTSGGGGMNASAWRA